MGNTAKKKTALINQNKIYGKRKNYFLEKFPVEDISHWSSVCNINISSPDCILGYMGNLGRQNFRDG